MIRTQTCTCTTTLHGMNAKREQRTGCTLLLVKAFVLVVLYCDWMLLLSRRVFLLGTAGVSSSLRVSTTTNPSPHTRSGTRMMSITSRSSSSSTTMFDAHPIGLGTFMMDRDQQVGTALPSAIAAGYRRIDCAPVYFNEDAVGDALAAAIATTAVDDEPGIAPVVSRQELFVVSKLASPFHRNVEAAVRKTLLDLRLDYLDLYLVHWPVAFQPVPIDPTQRGWENEDIDDSNDGRNIDDTVSIHETWRGMEAILEKGLVKSIGVSNFPVILLHELLSRASIPPVVNQCEAHPYLQQQKLVEYCQKRGVHFQAYSPLGTPGYKESGEPVVLDDPVLRKIAARHEVAPSQICLAWALQRGTSVVSKSVDAQHQAANLAAANITLSDEEMAEIAKLDRGYRFFRPHEWWGERSLAVFD